MDLGWIAGVAAAAARRVNPDLHRIAVADLHRVADPSRAGMLRPE